jgi:hypothetical protein
VDGGTGSTLVGRKIEKLARNERADEEEEEKEKEEEEEEEKGPTVPGVTPG